jgi:F-type H+-transporting ATPase subunit alpha
VELLKQPQYTPYPFEKQIVSIFAGTQGLLDDLPVSDIQPFEQALLRHFEDELPELLREIDEKGQLSDELREQLKKAVNDFKSHYRERKDEDDG